MPLGDQSRRLHAMRRAFRTVRQRQKETAPRLPDLAERQQRLREVRRSCVGNEELLEQAVASLEANGIRVLPAATAKEAVSLIKAELAGERCVVKSKSNVIREIGLGAALEEAGIEAIETDIGDRIVQLAHGFPSHPTGPASHLSRYEIADVLSQHLGRTVAPEPKLLTELVREEVVAGIERASIGLTGANAITAAEGAVLIVHNEGNVTQVMMRPRKHIIVTGIDKVYPNLDEAVNLARLQTFHATGAVVTSYINILGGPSKTADVEKQMVRGVHGPDEVVLVLVDNGRREIAAGPHAELLHCIGCGQCLVVCPAYSVYGPEYRGRGVELGGRGVALAGARDEGEQPPRGLEYCLSCGRCREECPVGIDVPGIIQELRFEQRRRLPQKQAQQAVDLVESHARWLAKGIGVEAVYLFERIVGSRRAH